MVHQILVTPPLSLQIKEARKIILLCLRESPTHVIIKTCTTKCDDGRGTTKCDDTTANHRWCLTSGTNIHTYIHTYIYIYIYIYHIKFLQVFPKKQHMPLIKTIYFS